jgi:pyruvate dehydrogenase E1 component beta subunit
MYGLLRSAIQSNDPVVVLEHKALYGERGEVTRGTEGLVPIGKARIVQPGNDVTVIAIGRSVLTAISALQLPSQWSAELIDLQTFIPWDKDSVLKSVEKTGRLVIIEENSFAGGWGSEIISFVVAELWGQMHAPPIRITSPDAPIPYAQNLEERYLPHSEYVLEHVNYLMETGKKPKPWWESDSA